MLHRPHQSHQFAHAAVMAGRSVLDWRATARQDGGNAPAMMIDADRATCRGHGERCCAGDRLAAQRLVRDDDRGSRIAVGAMRSSACCGMVIRSSASLASFPLSIVTVVQRRSASLRATVVNTCVSIRLSALRIVTVTPSSGRSAAVSAVDPNFAGRLGPKPRRDRLQQPFIVE